VSGWCLVGLLVSELHRGETESWVGQASSCAERSLSSISHAWSSYLADRTRRRPLLLWANALTAVMVLLLLAGRLQAQLWIIYLVAFSYGVAFTVLSSAGAGLQKDLLSRRRLGRRQRGAASSWPSHRPSPIQPYRFAGRSREVSGTCARRPEPGAGSTGLGAAQRRGPAATP
jgi:hypothetical protein